MRSVAEDLKEARENKGLSVQDIAARTRISRTFLEAIEKGDYDSLPGEVFVVGFLRTFARQVGLDDNEVVLRYKQERGIIQAEKTGQDRGDRTGETPDKGPGPGVAGRDSGSTLMWFSGVILVVLIIAVVYYIISTGEEARPIRKPVPEKKAAAKHVPETTPRIEAVEPMSNHTAVNAPSVPEPAPVTETEAVPEPAYPIEMVVKATAETWFAYETDSSGYKDVGILMPGREIRIRAREEVLIDSGNAGGIDITYNGRNLGPLGPSGAVRKNVLYTTDRAGAAGRPRTPRPRNIPPAAKKPADNVQ